MLAAFGGRILNTHPSLLPAFPGGHAVADALAHGATVTGCTVHLVDATLDGGPIVAQEAVPILPGDDATSLHDRIRAAEHRLLPRAVALLLADALVVDGRRVTVDLAGADARVPVPRRALLSVSDKTGLVELGRGLVARGFELVSTGGTARTLRDAGLPVTDVAGVTGSPEMLDGRVKTLHPRVHGGILADRRLDDHRRQLLAAAIAPFELVVVNLYPFSAALERPGITVDELIEEIDIGGPSMVRAAAKNHANVAVVTSPARYDEILAALDSETGLDDRDRRALALEAFAHTAAYDARIASALPARMAEAGLIDASDDPYPASLTIGLEKVETLRYGENPHQSAARYRRPGTTLADGPFTLDRGPLQGKALSYNNVLDAAAASALGRSLRGPGVVIVKHTNPCGAAERRSLPDAWDAALEADPVSAFGGVVALTRPVDRATAERLVSIFLEIVVAPAFDPDALEVLATKPNLRVLLDEALADDAVPGASPDPTGSIRTAGGAVLVTTPDVSADDPTTWTCATRRAPTDTGATRPGPGLASRPRRHLECDRPRPRPPSGRDGQRPDLPRRRGPPGSGQGARDARTRVDRGCRLWLGRVLPVPGRNRGLPRGRRHRLRPTGRLGPRRRCSRCRRRRTRDDAYDRPPPLPPLIARVSSTLGVTPSRGLDALFGLRHRQRCRATLL